MPVGNANEHTGIEINTNGTFNGAGRFSIANPEQSGNNDVKHGAYGMLVLDTQTGQYTYTPDFNKIKPLNSGETGIDEFKITLTPVNGVISTGTYRVEIIGDGDPTPATEPGKDLLIGNFSRRTDSTPDIITNFNPETDKLALDYEYYGLTDGIRFRTTTDRSELKRYSRRDVDLIALEEDDKTKLWWNQNGTRKGWGDGGMVAVIAGDSSSNSVISVRSFEAATLFSQENFV
jgi:VCBS repeat-containing protein